MSLKDLTILFAGSGAFGLPTLERLLAEDVRVAGVFTQPDKPAGRGNKLTPTPIAAFARAANLPTIATLDINGESLPPADLLVVIAFGQKISSHVVDRARLGAINLHASRLPQYRGAAPINWAIINGEPTSGNSVIRLADRMDAGAVLAMSEMTIGQTETAGELHDRLAVDGAGLVIRVAGLLLEGTVLPIEQDHSLATKAPKLSRESALIDWTRDARAIANQIRGMHPWPGCRVRLLDDENAEVDQLTLIRARTAGPLKQPNLASHVDDGGLVACGSGALEVIELQPDGRRPMTLAAYRNGKRWGHGLRLESLR